MYKCIITIMERRAKTKRENSLKRAENIKAPSFITDVKSIKENLRIKEILKTVKMNNSMRIKTPKGSRVMNNKDFVDDSSDELMNNETEKSIEPQAAVNSDVNLRYGAVQEPEAINDSVKLSSEDLRTSDNLSNAGVENSIENQSNNLSVDSINATKDDGIPEVVINLQPQSESPQIPHWNRKLSLDHTMLKRCEGLSQSELDLYSIGKSPLERKSSFFRKKMDSFFKNTTEIFKRQSVNSKSGNISRRGSMSVSLQSLNQAASDDNAAVDFNKLHLVNNKAIQLQGSVASLLSQSTVGHSESSQSVSQSDRPAADQTDQGGLVGSQPMLSSSQTFGAISSSSINSLNEGYPQDAVLNSRAISMSSGLDSANGQQRRKKSRSNRVTWLASEGLTNYFRRLIQDENSSDVQVCHSYQDLSNIPEVDMYAPKLDSKGRRLSYQRAVSGEDPVHPPRYQDSSLKRRSHIPENSETRPSSRTSVFGMAGAGVHSPVNPRGDLVNYELSNQLAEFSRNGVPPLKGFCIAPIPDEAFAYLHWAERAENLDEFYDWKKLGANEEARQAVIRELIFTEADYIKHLIAIVEVFMAAAHALQDGGKLLDIETERLFSNVPDVLNASLLFWESSIYPMLADAVEKGTPFNTELMAPGFCRFRDLFTPYEKFVGEQTRALDYLRSLSSNADFMMYLSWCHSQKSCNRLQLSDILVKPMQRLTKYRLILRRIIAHTDTEPERTSLIAMESFSKNYVLDLNRSIRQREELEKLDALASSIDTFEMDFKDEDMDRYFRMYASLNLKAPMANCLPSHSRTLIHQGDLRFKDNVKEMDVRAILLTDMLLICKKLSKGSPYQYKLIRPKYMIEKMIQFPKFSSRKELVALIFVMVDEVGSSYQSFALSEPTKDPNGQSTLKLWEQKVKEAKLTYDLGVWFAKNPSRDLSEVEMDSSSDYALSASSKMGMKQNSDDLNIEREARERVAAMLHRSMGASTEYDFSQASMTTDSFDAGEISGITGMSGARTPGLHNLRHPMHRNSTGSSRNSRLSSFNQSTSAASHDEPQAGPSRLHYRAGSSVEHLIPPLNPEDAVTSITVNVVSESESETIVPVQQPPPPPSPRLSHNTLHVQPQSGVMALVHSLPDLTIEPSPTRSTQSTSPQSASEKLYTSHQELLQRNRLSASQHHQYLSPHHRGTSYPPPSPTRGSLKRSLAFSYSFKNPPLSKMGHVNSQAQLPADTGPSTSQQHKVERDTTASPTPGLSTSTDKKDKKSKQVSTRNKGGSSLSLNRKEDKGD